MEPLMLKTPKIIYTKTNGKRYAHAIKTIKRRYVIACSNQGERTNFLPETTPITDLKERFEEQRFSVPATVRETEANKPAPQEDLDKYKQTLPRGYNNLSA